MTARVTYAEYKRRTTRRSTRVVGPKAPVVIASLAPKGNTPHRIPPPLEHRLAERERKNRLQREKARERAGK